MTKNELVQHLLNILHDDAVVTAEFADIAQGGNVTSEIVNVVFEDGKIVLVTDRAL